MSKKNQDKNERRRRHYIDERLQGGLLVALLAMEVLLLGTAMAFIYYDLNLLVEEQMYRIHIPVADNGLPPLIVELLQITPWIIVVNIAAIAVVEGLWSRHVAEIVGPLKELLSAVAALDLRDRSGIEQPHEVLEKAHAWLHEERERCIRVRQAVDELAQEDKPAEIRQRIKQIRCLLPDGVVDSNA